MRTTHIGVEIKIFFFFESWIRLEKLTFLEYSGRLPFYKEKSHRLRPAIEYLNICIMSGVRWWHGG